MDNFVIIIQKKVPSPWTTVKNLGEKKNLRSLSRSEIGKTWRLLPIEEKAKFGEPEVVEVAATNLTGEQPHHCQNNISNNFNVPPTDEQIPPTTNRLDYGDQTINTRCTPSRWCRIVNKLSEEQKQVIRALGFGNLLALNCGRLRLKICRWLVDNFDTKACSIHIHGRRFVINSSIFARVFGISDQGDPIAISGDVPNKDFWESKLSMTSRGIFLKDIEHCLEEMTTADDEFKLFYFHSLRWEPPIVDKALIPAVCWTNVKIKKCVIRLHTKGGVGRNQATLKTELNDIRTKVNFLYAKFSSVEDKNLDNDLPNTNSPENSKNHTPINPRSPLPTRPPPPHLSVPTIQHPTFEVSSNDTRSLPQHEQTISKFTPSWMKAPIETALEEGKTTDLPMEDQPTDDPDHVPPVLTIPTLLDEDTFYDDTHEQESQSCNKRRLINTRSSVKRKPGRYQISPYIAGPIPASTKYRYGPLGIPLNTYDEQLINYIFAKDLPSSEVIVDLGHLRVTWKGFRTLEPSSFVDSEYTVLTCTDGKQYSLKKSLSKLRESYMYDLRICEKIYIPINDLLNHWYLEVVHVQKRMCEIWDSKPPRRKDDLTRLTQVQKVMQSLDIVLADKIVVAFPTTFSFTTFTMSYAKAPEQSNGFDCSLLLCMFMDDNYPTPLQMKSFQSDCQRLVLARFLALFPGNNNLLSLKKNAKEHYTNLLANRSKMILPPVQKLRGKAAALMD
ncbi:hypothetical protein Dsin_018655 [Dipteronia sinensis]|uniref:Ubiquitin-like protease family profile domain-containing protein n=1 Tax=Dipteronia sinensis TaxID=43782 RepID=A0AAE0A6K3_9ROSI|nr:hypothetical protein Dsin_018655 [Dipteronia sinensis]